MVAQLNAEQLLAAAEQAKADLDAATSRSDVETIFDHYAGTLGYKVVARMLLGASAADATARWRAKLEVP